MSDPWSRDIILKGLHPEKMNYSYEKCTKNPFLRHMSYVAWVQLFSKKRQFSIPDILKHK